MPLQVQKEPILYKYIVDGEWKVNPEEKITKDFEGNENNVLDPEDLKELVSIPGSLIPESGLVYNNNSTTSKDLDESKTKDTSKENTGAAIGSSSNDYKSTVLPKEEPHQTSLTGEPGIQIPQDKEQLAVFDQFENTDSKALNEDVKEVGTANTTDATTKPQNFNQGIQIPQDTAAFEKFEDTDPKTLNEDVKEVGTAGAVPSESNGLDKIKQSDDSIAAGPTGVEDDTAAATAAAAAAAAGAGVGAGAAGSSSTPSNEGDNLKKVKRVEYKAKPKKDAADEAIDSNVSSRDAEFVPVPAAIETGNDASNLDYINNDTKVSPEVLKDEATENNEINKKIREEFEDPKSKDVNAPTATVTKDTAASPEDEQLKPEEKKDHSTAKTLGAAALGGVGGAGLGSALGSGSDSRQSGDDFAHGDSVHGPFSTSKEAKQSISADPQDSTAPVVVDDAHPKTLDPKAGQEAPAPGTTAPATLAAEPEIKPVTGSDLDAGEGKEVNASPVAKDQAPHAVAGGASASKSRVSAAAAPVVVNDEDDEEEEIIIAQGNQDDILAAVEASEGHDVTLEEIKPTKSEQERLTKEAQLAAQVDGPITIEKVVVPEEEVLSSKGSTKDVASDKQSSSKGKTTTAKDNTPKKQTASDVPVKNTKRADKGKDDEEKKKKGFRSFLKKIVS